MGDSLITIVVIGLVAVLMFIFPVMTMADRSDDIAQLAVETETREFVDDVRTTGKLTLDKYEKFVENISATGHSYTVEMTSTVNDETPGKKVTQADATKYGENASWVMYTSQIIDTLNNPNNHGVMSLAEGSDFSVQVKNNDVTLSQQFNNFLYKVTGNDSYVIAASHSGIVTTTGSGN